MSEKAFVPLVIIAAVVVLGTASAAWSTFVNDGMGRFVIPCCLNGVNPAYHPDIFGNPAVAREYGLVPEG
jgi:hypothetical protein